MSYVFDLRLIAPLDLKASFETIDAAGGFNIGDVLVNPMTATEPDERAHLVEEAGNCLHHWVYCHRPELCHWLVNNVNGTFSFIGRIVALGYSPYMVIVTTCLAFEDQGDAALFTLFSDYPRSDV